MEGSLVAYKVFTNGSVLPASDVNTYLMNQSVMVFADSATRAAALTAPVEGMLTWLQDVNRYEYYTGAAWASLPASLVLVKAVTVGTAVSTIPITGAFSSTYDNYRITYSGGTASTNSNMYLILGAASASYFGAAQVVTYSSGASSNLNDNNVSRFNYIGQSNNVSFEIMNPFLSRNTNVFGSFFTTTQSGSYSGQHNVSTSFTDFTLGMTTGNLTGGTVYVYGYKKD
jgi:hypothetical protein